MLVGVMQYLVTHPDAKDTEEGIGEWWALPSERWSRRDVRSALAFLQSRGWVTARAVGDRGRLYGANTERLAEIETFLARMEQGGKPPHEE